ncbi:MAG: STAS/SEC14 domain-containing protein [Parvibaculaceae bacterium]
MFEKLVAPDNVIAIHLSGTLSVDDVKHYRTLVEEKIAEHERFGMCIDLTGIEKVGVDALTEDAKVEFELLTHLSKFRRCAFVSDLSWPKTLANTLGRVIPLLEMKSFTGTERATAIAWAAMGPAQEVPKPSSAAFTTAEDIKLQRRAGK